MKQLFFGLAAALSLVATADTAYPVDPAVRAENLKKVEAFREKAYWKDAPFAVAAVEATSGIKRTPALFPEDGDFTGPVRALMAKDEYEGASFVLFGFKDVDQVMVNVQVPGLEADVKVVKVWYQQGSAWGSFFSDPIRRIETPELMLHDDDLIHVDYANKENFVRCDYSKDKTAYRWVSFGGQAVDHSYEGGIKNEWIHDAPTLKPFKVRKDEFKQLIVTFHAAANAQPGLRKGTIALSVAGKKVCDVPCEVKVLPFALPLPAVFRDTNRPFMATPYGGIRSYGPKDEAVARNMVRHNVRHCLLPGINATNAKQAFEFCKRTGLDTEYLFTALPGCGLTTSYPAQETDKNYGTYLTRRDEVSNAMAAIREVFGPNAKAYSYGIDEGSAWTVRAERSTWKDVIHANGGRTVVATAWHPFILFNLDYANVPRHPRHAKKANADAFHAGNPDGLIGWYADPHSGPENPDYTRRIYGWQTWRNNYDCSCQYIMYRDNWNDFWVPAEAFLRGLMLVYPQDGDLLDTIEWEGVREAMDDVRYGTLLKRLAEKARLSKNVDTVYAGRAALTWVAQVDCEHSALDYLRCEMVRRILDLQDRLAKEK